MSNANAAVVGDIVRAYDFRPAPGREACYIEGEVIAKGRVPGYGFNAYSIKVAKDTAYPEEDNRVGEVIYAPLETLFDWDGRVAVIDAIE